MHQHQQTRGAPPPQDLIDDALVRGRRKTNIRCGVVRRTASTRELRRATQHRRAARFGWLAVQPEFAALTRALSEHLESIGRRLAAATDSETGLVDPEVAARYRPMILRLQAAYKGAWRAQLLFTATYSRSSAPRAILPHGERRCEARGRARRPRAASTRSSAASGDSPADSDPPGEAPPAGIAPAFFASRTTRRIGGWS